MREYSLLQRYMIFILNYKAGPGNFSPGGGVILTFWHFVKEILTFACLTKIIVLGTWTCSEDAFAG
jgi:hypothetical protein